MFLVKDRPKHENSQHTQMCMKIKWDCTIAPSVQAINYINTKHDIVVVVRVRLYSNC